MLRRARWIIRTYLNQRTGAHLRTTGAKPTSHRAPQRLITPMVVGISGESLERLRDVVIRTATWSVMAHLVTWVMVNDGQ